MPTVSLQLIGQPVLVEVLGAAMAPITFAVVNRLAAKVQLAAETGAGVAAAFLYSDALAGIVGRVPAGGSVVLPVLNGQTWYVMQDATAPGATLRATCVE